MDLKQGSGIYRSLQFSGFEATYTYFDNPICKQEIPFTHGVQIRVILGGMVGGSLRAIVECPLEYAKTHRQIGKDWYLKDVFTGLKITWIRSLILLPIYFVSLDSFRRHLSDTFSSPLIGPFLAGGGASIVAWSVIWPFEYMRTQVAANYLDERHWTLTQRLKYIMRERGGFLGLYRGLGPGLFRSFFANGFAMIVMQYAQRKISEYGLRD